MYYLVLHYTKPATAASLASRPHRHAATSQGCRPPGAFGLHGEGCLSPHRKPRHRQKSAPKSLESKHFGEIGSWSGRRVLVGGQTPSKRQSSACSKQTSARHGLLTRRTLCLSNPLTRVHAPYFLCIPGASRGPLSLRSMEDPAPATVVPGRTCELRVPQAPGSAQDGRDDGLDLVVCACVFGSDALRRECAQRNAM